MRRIDIITIINEEKALYCKSHKTINRITHQKQYMIWKYLSSYRMAQYYSRKLGERTILVGKIIPKLLRMYYLRKKNILGEKVNIEIANHCQLGRMLNLCHGGIVINGNVGDNCILHGNNIIGNKGLGKESDMPVIGNGVDVGAGAVIIGNVRIADNCIVGAGAVVVKSIEQEGVTVVGIPAKMR